MIPVVIGTLHLLGARGVLKAKLHSLRRDSEARVGTGPENKVTSFRETGPRPEKAAHEPIARVGKGGDVIFRNTGWGRHEQSRFTWSENGWSNYYRKVVREFHDSPAKHLGERS